MAKQLNVKISEEIDRRLHALADRAGRSKTSLAVEAIETYLEDLEDRYALSDALADFRSSDDFAIPLSEVAWPDSSVVSKAAAED